MKVTQSTKILLLLAIDGPNTVRGLRERTRAHDKTVRRALAAFVELGLVRRSRPRPPKAPVFTADTVSILNYVGAVP